MLAQFLELKHPNVQQAKVALNNFLTECEKSKGFNINKAVSPKKLTPLHKGLRLGMPIELLTVMVDHGASLTVFTDTKRNAFHYAARLGNPELILALLKLLDEKEPNAKKRLETVTQIDTDEDGSFTPLGYAKEMGDKKTVSLINLYIDGLKKL